MEMAITEPPESVDIRIETSQPGASACRSTSPGVRRRDRDSLEDAGGQVTRGHPRTQRSRSCAVGARSGGADHGKWRAVGGVLKKWWHRNDAKRATLTFNGESLSLRACRLSRWLRSWPSAPRWDERWRRVARTGFRTATAPKETKRSNRWLCGVQAHRGHGRRRSVRASGLRTARLRPSSDDSAVTAGIRSASRAATLAITASAVSRASSAVGCVLVAVGGPRWPARRWRSGRSSAAGQ